MTKTMGKFCCLAKDMKPGTWTGECGNRWIRFGKHTWRVLSVEAKPGGKEAFLLTEDIVDIRAFNTSKSNDWSISDIKRWLNGSFYNSAFSDEERNAILTTSYSYGRKHEDSGKTDSSKIFLLSDDEAFNKNYFADWIDRVAYCNGTKQYWWLRSMSNYGYAEYIDDGGCGPYTFDGFLCRFDVALLYGIRPALVLNLSDPIFASSKYEVWYNLPDTEEERKKTSYKLLARVRNANLEEVTRLIQEGADVNITYEDGETLLMVAAEENPNPEIFRLLMEKGADVNASDKQGRTPLMNAATSNTNPDVLELLIEKGADVNASDRDGVTSLMLAVINNENLDILRLLIEKRANVNASDEKGRTPLLLAAEYNKNPDILRLLIEKGADVNASDTSGRKAFNYAIANEALADTELYESHNLYESKPVALEEEVGLAKDMKPGTWTGEGGHRWIRFGKHTWRVLSVENKAGGKEAFLLTEDVVDIRAFNASKNNDWGTSDIKEWLNESFYNSVFSDGERNAILTASYRYGGRREGSDKADSSQIFLLSYNEARNDDYFAGAKDRVALFGGTGQIWWLRSPGYNDNRAAFVYSDGDVYDSHGAINVDSSYGIRPALIINLSSPIFTSSEYKVLNSPR